MLQRTSGRFTLGLMLANVLYALSWIMFSIGHVATATHATQNGGALSCGATGLRATAGGVRGEAGSWPSSSKESRRGRALVGGGEP